MIKLNNNAVNNAKVVKMNRNSLLLELAPNEQILVSRKVFNKIQEDPKIPMYSVEREFRGTTSLWLAIPLTI